MSTVGYNMRGYFLLYKHYVESYYQSKILYYVINSSSCFVIYIAILKVGLVGDYLRCF